MLISGLWKLAAMAGVIGVGLVAVFQAQQGLETPAIVTPGGDEAGDLAALVTADIGRPTTAVAASPDAPLQLTDPFAAALDVKEAGPNELATPRRLLDSPAISSRGERRIASTAIEPGDDASAPSGPGLDFREDFNSGPALGKALPTLTGRSKSAVVTASFNETSTEPASDNVDPFAEAGQKPSGQQANDASDPFSTEPLNTNPVKSAVDLLQDAAPTEEPANSGTPADFGSPVKPLASDPGFSSGPAAQPDPAATTDPFADSAPSLTTPGLTTPARPGASRLTPARSTTGSDPFEASPFSEVPPKSSPSLTSPAREPVTIVRPESIEAADPFGGSAPPAVTPNRSPAVRPETPAADEPRDSMPSLTEPRTRGANGRGAMPRLPTELPGANGLNTEAIDPLESGRPEGGRIERDRPEIDPFDDDAARRERELRSTRRTRDAAEQPTADDLVGDGTVTNATPRGLQQPRLTLEKIAPEQAVLGEPLVYQVIVKNVGGSDANQVVVEDRIPKGTELTGTAPKAEMIDKKLIWRIGTLKPNEVRKISIRLIPRQEGPIGSVARVNFATEVAAEIIVAAPQLSLKVDAPREVRVGEIIDLTFLLKNSGGAAANNVSVRDLIPEGLQHEAAADIECPIGKLGPNESREIVLQVTAVKPGRVKNRAILSADGGITQELESIIDIIGEHLVLTRTGQNRIYAERPAVFTNSVKNDGNAAVKHVKVAEVVPAGFEFIEASDGGQFDPQTRSIHWTVGPLAAGDETAVTAKLLAKTPGMQLGKISATGSAGSAATVKSEVDVVGRPELQMETLNAAGLIAIGDKLTSKIHLKNSGSAPARNVALSISVPRELRLIEVRGAKYVEAKNIIRFEPLAELGPRETASFELVMEATAEADARMDLQITADHLPKPSHRIETVHIATEVR